MNRLDERGTDCDAEKLNGAIAHRQTPAFIDESDHRQNLAGDEMFKRPLSPILGTALFFITTLSATWSLAAFGQDTKDVEPGTKQSQTAAGNMKVALMSTAPAAKKHTLTQEDLERIRNKQSAESDQQSAFGSQRRVAGKIFVGALTAGTAAILIHLICIPCKGGGKSKRRGDETYSLLE